ncbi:MAG: class A beta-lactamase [Rhodanobacteraceae bacterium]
MHRRIVLKSAALAPLALWPVFSLATIRRDAAERLAALEHVHGGRLGVAILDTSSGRRVVWRGDERFLLCSTFKLLLAAAVLRRVDRGVERLDRRIIFGKDVLLEYAPTTKQHVGATGMTIAQLCEAAITLSDNTAANLLLREVGGPAAVTHYARNLGDPLTRLDRNEPELNQLDGDRDTTTPEAMLGDMHELLLGDALSSASRERLIHWLLGCQTGLQSLRAGLPPGWRIGDKTGQSNGRAIGANNDIAIVWPPDRKPLLVTAYYMTHTTDVAARRAVLAKVGGIVAAL